MILDSLLTHLGLSQKEKDIFLTITKHGVILPSAVAKLTCIQRTTVYSVSKELIKKGLIIEINKRKKQYLAPAPFEQLLASVEHEEKALQQKKKIAKETIQKLKPLLGNAHYQVPNFTFVAHSDIDQFLRKRTAVWQQSILDQDKVWWGFQDHTFVNCFEPWIDWSWKNAPDNLSLKLLSNESAIEEKMKQKPYLDKRQIKSWKNNNFTATTWICGNYVILTTTQTEPFSLTEISDALIANNFRELFKTIWETI